jgi:hypothetical protein
MTCAFHADLDAALSDVNTSRGGLVSAIQALDGASLQRERRGGWPVWRVIQHA